MVTGGRVINSLNTDNRIIWPMLLPSVYLCTKAVSKVGAQGVMQLMPTTAKQLGVGNSFSARQNIKGGINYLKKMYVLFNGNIKKTLAAYNAGPSNVKKYNGIPPFKETQRYVKKVLKKYKEYLKAKK